MKLTTILFSAAVLALGTSAFAITGKEVVQKALDVPEPEHTMAQVYMDLIDKGGKTERRQMMEYGKSAGGLKSVAILFQSPASIKDTRYLQLEQGGGKKDLKWIYMPDLRNSRQINADGGSGSFMGSDATYDDMSTRDIDDDTHELLGEESKNGYNCYKVQSTPVNPKDSQYKYRIQWIDKATWVPVYAEMYDKQGKLLKVLTVEKLSKEKGQSGKAYDIPRSTLLENVQSGHKTRMIIEKLQLDGTNIPDRLFTTNWLNTGR